MNERARQWLTPGLLIQIATTLVMLGGSWGIMSNRMEAVLVQNERLEKQIAEVRSDLRTLQNAQGDVIRAQERMSYMAARMEALERFKDTQEQINVRVFSTLSKLGG